MLDCEEVFGESNTTYMKVMPTLEYDKHQIFKATLVSQLNADPISSKDRLTQVRNSIYLITTMITLVPPLRPLSC